MLCLRTGSRLTLRGVLYCKLKSQQSTQMSATLRCPATLAIDQSDPQVWAGSSYVVPGYVMADDSETSNIS